MCMRDISTSFGYLATNIVQRLFQLQVPVRFLRPTVVNPFAKWAGYAIMGVVCFRKEQSNMGTFIVALVFAAFLFFILTAGYNEDKTWNL
jgi:hypothetical protein